jgi:dephospho-CoA kinase
VIDADALARSAVEPGTPAHAAIAARWPQAIGPSGAIDREALATIVFSDEKEREALNAIVHPAVRAAAAEAERGVPRGTIVVHDIPLLFETGQASSFDATVLVTAPNADRIRRVMQRSGLERAEVQRRIDAQIDPALAKRLATLTVENSGSMEDLKIEAERVFGLLSNLSPAPR